MIDRLNAALSDRYRVERELGEGGMATVFLAEDLKHNREVAIKVLKPELAAVVGAERFLAEIETTAGLQHPHILPLFDSGEADGFVWYAMPYVQGESLREKIDREKQLPVGDAVAIAGKVAGALQAAHDQGVVHRDIKPANILLDRRGEPLVADFGIALAVQEAGGGRLTETGLSLGTPYYMSPEQATADRDPDARSDVYSLGCMLYEMLTGEPPFNAPTAQAVLARILTGAPAPPTELRSSIPAHVEGAVLRALEKLPADRFRSARDFAAALDDPAFRHGPGGTRPVGASASRVRRWWKPAALAALPALLIGALVGRNIHDTPSQPTSWTFTLDDALPVAESGLSAGPEGEIAYRAAPSDDPTGYVPWGLGIPVVVRRPGEREPVVLEGTERALDGVLSPDGAWFAYRDAGSAAWDQPVMRVSTEGGAPVTVWRSSDEAPFIFWPWAWSASGWIYGHFFDPGASSRVGRIPAAGGDPETLFLLEAEKQVTLSNSSLQIVNVELLPGERTLLFDVGMVQGNEGHRILSLDIASGDTAEVTRGWGAQWSPSGHLVFARGSSLLAAPFDPRSAELTGEPVPLDVEIEAPTRWPRSFDVSPDGSMAVLTGLPDWTDFTGAVLASPEEESPLRLRTTYGVSRISLSPDGGTIAYNVGGGTLIQDVETGSNDEIEETGITGSTWSPDGSAVAMGHLRREVLLIKETGDGESPREVRVGRTGLEPTDWLSDGRILAESQPTGSEGDVDLLVVDTADGSATPLLDGDWLERQGRVSPDGRWLAYESWATGEREFYVRSFPDLGPELRVSREALASGTIREFRAGPYWGPDGRSLFYLEGDSVWRADLRVEGGDVSVTDREGVIPVNEFDELHGVHPDGRLLLHRLAGDDLENAVPPRLVVITDLAGELARMEEEWR